MKSRPHVFCLFVLGTIAVAHATPLTSIQLADGASEAAHKLTDNNAPVVVNSEPAPSESGRRLTPANETSPASLAFDVRIDPDVQNYLTLRLWGGDPNWTAVHLISDGDNVNLGNLWWHVTKEAPVPGRFLYRTFPIPIEVTRGKTSLRLRLENAPTAAAPGQFRNSDAPPPKMNYRASFVIYAIHTHTGPWFDIPKTDVQGKPFTWGPPVPRPADYPEDTEARLLERARADIAAAIAYDVLRSRYDTGHRHDTRVLETLPLIYNTVWSGHYHERALAERVRDAIDIHVKRQAAQGGDPGTMFYRGWGSHGRIAHACTQMHAVFENAGWLDQPLTLETPRGPVTLTRRQAYADFFHDAFEWRRKDRRSFTNQVIYVAHTLYRLQKALRLLGDERALTEAQTLRYVHEAFGLAPLRSREFGIDAANSGYPYHVTTRAVLTREKGYVDSYGELSYVITRIAQETGDPASMDFARRFVRTRSVFRIPSNDTEGRGVLRGIGAISWRSPTFPFRVAYSGIEEAAILEDPVSLRLGQLEIAHGRLHLLPARPERGPHWSPSDSIHMLEHYRKIKNLPPTRHRLPTEPGQPDFVWADPENGVFVFRHGDNQVFGSFWNLDPANGRGIGDRGVVHCIRPELERLIEFPPDSLSPQSGLFLTVKHPYGNRIYSQLPPPPGMTKWQDEPPQAMDHRAGRACFFHLRMGPYIIAMNTTEPGTYRESTWLLPSIDGATSARDLATGETVNLTQPLDIPAGITRVFVLP